MATKPYEKQVAAVEKFIKDHQDQKLLWIGVDGFGREYDRISWTKLIEENAEKIFLESRAWAINRLGFYFENSLTLGFPELRDGRHVCRTLLSTKDRKDILIIYELTEELCYECDTTETLTPVFVSAK